MKRTSSVLSIILVGTLFLASCSPSSFLQDIRSRFSKKPLTEENMPTDTPRDPVLEKLYTTVLEIPIESSFVFLNGEKTALDTPAAFISDSEITMIPLKFISDVLGAKVEWYPNTKEISILQRDGEIQLQINSLTAYVNGVPYTLSTPPMIHQEYSFIPLQFVASHLKFEVEWIPETKTVILRK
jgi:hypothetical protein